jgi:hypothetical protein
LKKELGQLKFKGKAGQNSFCKNIEDTTAIKTVNAKMAALEKRIDKLDDKKLRILESCE